MEAFYKNTNFKSIAEVKKKNNTHKKRDICDIPILENLKLKRPASF